jgi:mono/diheme cytochrome c family protein
MVVPPWTSARWLAGRRLVPILGCLLVLGTVSCGRSDRGLLPLSTELLTVASDGEVELPAAHRESLEQALLKYFGPWERPRFLVPRIPEEGEEEDVAPEEPESEELPVFERITAERLRQGQAVYLRQCALCHGVTGDGAGPAADYLKPKPRDYRRGIFKFTSTEPGAKPRRSDLVRTIRYGAKGTSMPAFRFLPEEEVQAVVDYILMLSFRGQFEYVAIEELSPQYGEDEPLEMADFEDSLMQIAEVWDLADQQFVLPLSRRPAFDDESIRLGREAFLNPELGCSKCHGADGRGHTQENVGRDPWGNEVQAADLTSGLLHGGRRPVDIYRRIHSGVNPMPSFVDALQDDPDTLWHLVHFVLAVAEGRPLPEIEISNER